MSFGSTSFRYDVDKEKKSILAQGHCLCEVCMASPWLSRFSLGAPFHPTSQRHAYEGIALSTSSQSQ